MLKERGVKLGKPRGCRQKSIFEPHKDKIKEWCRLGFSFSRQAKALDRSVTGLIHYVRNRRRSCPYMLK